MHNGTKYLINPYKFRIVKKVTVHGIYVKIKYLVQHKFLLFFWKTEYEVNNQFEAEDIIQMKLDEIEAKKKESTTVVKIYE